MRQVRSGGFIGQAGISRRGLLGGGVLAVAGLSAGGWLAARLTDGTSAPLISGGMLGAAEQNMLAVVADAMLSDVLEGDPSARQAQLQWIVSNIDAGILGLPVRLQKETLQLLAMLAFAPSRLLLANRWAAWHDGQRSEIQVALLALRDSSTPLRRIVFRVLRDLVVGGFYGDRRSWASLDYPGPVIDNKANG